MTSENKNFDFGFEKVSAKEKQERVRETFDRVSSRYDLMNDLMSLGIHRLWKKLFVESLPLHQGGVYLDVAGGTGDIGAAISKRLNEEGFEASVFLCDSNPAMIEVGKKRFPHLSWSCGTAESLPFHNNAVDVYTVAFGLRNMTHRAKVLEEAFRVLRPGGKFACLEFSQPLRPLQKLYDFYSFQIIPRLGKWVAQDEAAYQYLSESIRTFLTCEELAKVMGEVGFTHVNYTRLTGGIVALHTGYKASIT